MQTSRPGHRIKTMNGKLAFENIPIEKISFWDERFRTSYFYDPEPLLRSLRRAGLASPPLLRREGRRYVVIAGWKRVLACRALGLKTLPALITKEINDRRLFFQALEDNTAVRGLRLGEKAEAIRKLRGLGVSDRVLRTRCLPLLNLPPRADFLASLLALAGAEKAVRQLVEEKDYPLAVALSLLRFPPRDRRVLMPLLRPLGRNKAKEILDEIWEIGVRDSLSASRILRRPEIREILDSAGLSPLQKAERVRLLIKRWRFPHLRAKEKAFAAACRRLGLPPGVSLQPTPFFESEDLTIAVRFRSREELEARLGQLIEIAGSESMSGLFKE